MGPVLLGADQGDSSEQDTAGLVGILLHSLQDVVDADLGQPGNTFNEYVFFCGIEVLISVKSSHLLNMEKDGD